MPGADPELFSQLPRRIDDELRHGLQSILPWLYIHFDMDAAILVQVGMENGDVLTDGLRCCRITELIDFEFIHIRYQIVESALENVKSPGIPRGLPPTRLE